MPKYINDNCEVFTCPDSQLNSANLLLPLFKMFSLNYKCFSLWVMELELIFGPIVLFL